MTEIDSNNKITAAENYKKKLVQLQQNHSENFIIYSDSLKLASFKASAGVYTFYIMNFQQSYY